MSPDLNAQAAQSQAQGQAMLGDYNNKAADYKSQYGNYQGQADAANMNVGDYTKAMQGDYNVATGTGNAGSTYNYGLNKQLGDLKYDPNQMASATNNLNQSTGALSAYSDFANTGASKWGMNAGGFAAANAGALGQINNNIASNQGQVAQLMDKYKTAQTGANQFAGQVVQEQHETLGGLQQVFSNASNQRDSAQGMMNFYDKLAQQQGGLNAEQQKSYADAQNAMAAAQQAVAQAGLLAQKTSMAKMKNQEETDTMNTPAYQTYKNGTTDINGKPIISAPTANGAPAIVPGTERPYGASTDYTVGGKTFNQSGDTPGTQSTPQPSFWSSIFKNVGRAY